MSEKVDGRGKTLSPVPLVDRLLARVDFGDKPDDCWEWKGGKRRDGYGQFRIKNDRDGNVNLRAHNAILDFAGVPRGENSHHVCENRGCVNPDHIEPMSHAEHRRRHAIEEWKKRRQVA